MKKSRSAKKNKRERFYDGITKVALSRETDKYCFVTYMRTGEKLRTGLELHHVFGGPNRKHSDYCGLCVYLCHDYHRHGTTGVHADADLKQELQQYAQAEFEKFNTRDDFMRIFHRNTLEV
ncbi:MAG: hypothetical protein R3Y18_00055 [Bacillota bacterium]